MGLNQATLRAEGGGDLVKVLPAGGAQTLNARPANGSGGDGGGEGGGGAQGMLLVGGVWIPMGEKGGDEAIAGTGRFGGVLNGSGGEMKRRIGGQADDAAGTLFEQEDLRLELAEQVMGGGERVAMSGEQASFLFIEGDDGGLLAELADLIRKILNPMRERIEGEGTGIVLGTGNFERVEQIELESWWDGAHLNGIGRKALGPLGREAGEGSLAHGEGLAGIAIGGISGRPEKGKLLRIVLQVVQVDSMVGEQLTVLGRKIASDAGKEDRAGEERSGQCGVNGAAAQIVEDLAIGGMNTVKPQSPDHGYGGGGLRISMAVGRHGKAT